MYCIRRPLEKQIHDNKPRSVETHKHDGKHVADCWPAGKGELSHQIRIGHGFRLQEHDTLESSDTS